MSTHPRPKPKPRPRSRPKPSCLRGATPRVLPWELVESTRAWTATSSGPRPPSPRHAARQQPAPCAGRDGARHAAAAGQRVHAPVRPAGRRRAARRAPNRALPPARHAGPGRHGRVLRGRTSETLGREVAIKVLHGGPDETPQGHAPAARGPGAGPAVAPQRGARCTRSTSIDGRLSFGHGATCRAPRSRSGCAQPRGRGATCVRLFRQAGRGLAAARGRGPGAPRLQARQRDPRRRQGAVRVLDFGLARGVGGRA